MATLSRRRRQRRSDLSRRRVVGRPRQACPLGLTGIQINGGRCACSPGDLRPRSAPSYIVPEGIKLMAYGSCGCGPASEQLLGPTASSTRSQIGRDPTPLLYARQRPGTLTRWLPRSASTSRSLRAAHAHPERLLENSAARSLHGHRLTAVVAPRSDLSLDRPRFAACAARAHSIPIDPNVTRRTSQRCKNCPSASFASTAWVPALTHLPGDTPSS